jgi:hypothetical protein
MKLREKCIQHLVNAFHYKDDELINLNDIVILLFIMM